MKRIICLLLCLLLCGQVFAVGKYGLDAKMQVFLSEHGLNEKNFSVSYYNLNTGESYSFNEDAFLPVGKLWTLPLHMYYYEEEALGTFLPPIGSTEEYQISGMTLEDCRYHSIILADERISDAMCQEIGSLPLYLEQINTRYGMHALEELPEAYWEGDVYSARFLMNCLRTVESHPEFYSKMMANFRFAQKVDAFAGNNLPYDLVQIRGEADGFVSAVAEISAQQPYLLVAIVSEQAGGDEVLAALSDLLCEHLKELVGDAPATQANAQSSNLRGSTNLRVSERNQWAELGQWFGIAFGVAAVIALVVGVIVIVKKKQKEKRRHR